MVHRNSRHVIRRENNVLEVDFSREPDPPAPRFPGARGLRGLNEGGTEPEGSFAAHLVAGLRWKIGRQFDNFQVA